MNVSSLIPPQYRLAATIAVLAALVLGSLGIGALVGWKASAWRSDAAWSAKLAESSETLAGKDRDINELKLSLSTQNAAVKALQAQTKAAEAAQAEARVKAATEARASAARIKQLQDRMATGSTTGELLQSYWEMSR